METGLRLFLMILACFIFAGIIWDYTKGRHLQKGIFNLRRRGADKQTSRQEDRLLDPLEDDFSEEMHDHVFRASVVNKQRKTIEPKLNDSFEEVVLQKEAVEPKMPASTKANESTAIREPIVLYIMARKNQGFSGQRLLQAFKEAHLFYGDQQIFHRKVTGSNNPVFSAASAIEPGFFDLAEMTRFITPGILLFFDPNESESLSQDFDLMLRTARRLTVFLDGELKDCYRRDLTIQRLEHFQSQLRTLETAIARF